MKFTRKNRLVVTYRNAFIVKSDQKAIFRWSCMCFLDEIKELQTKAKKLSSFSGHIEP